MANATGEIGQLREEELPVVRVIVPPDPDGRVFEGGMEAPRAPALASCASCLMWRW